jgi:nucleoid-associated protein YgaU
MRTLFPARRLFACSTCHRRFLVRPEPAEGSHRLAATVLVLGLASAASLGALAWSWSAAPVPAATVMGAPPAARASSTTCPRVHVFREGETLESIAAQELGDANRWQQIRIANRWLDVAENGLEPGARLVVPAPCAG